MTAFKTKYGIFEWFVIPFGLVIAFDIFQKYINLVFKKILDEFCSTYIDDILIYIDGSRTKNKTKFKTFAKNRTAIKCQQMRIRNKNDEIFGFHH